MQEYRPGRFQGLPVIVRNLIIINVIMVLLELSLFSTLHIDLGDYLALHYWRSGLFRPWQLITHMFMHGSANPALLQGTLLHIGLNMLGLWMFGSVIERVWGPRRFLLFYLFCGVGAALCQWGMQAIHFEPVVSAFHQYANSPSLPAFNQFAEHYLSGKIDAPRADELNNFFRNWQLSSSDTAFLHDSVKELNDALFGGKIDGFFHEGILDGGMVGASGAIFGVLLAFAYIFPNAMIYAYLFVPLKAKWAILIFAAIELSSGFYNSPGDNVAHFAHLGGMLFGFIFIKIWGAHPSRRIN